MRRRCQPALATLPQRAAASLKPNRSGRCCRRRFAPASRSRLTQLATRPTAPFSISEEAFKAVPPAWLESRFSAMAHRARQIIDPADIPRFGQLGVDRVRCSHRMRSETCISLRAFRNRSARGRLRACGAPSEDRRDHRRGIGCTGGAGRSRIEFYAAAATRRDLPVLAARAGILRWLFPRRTFRIQNADNLASICCIRGGQKGSIVESLLI